MNQQNKKDRAFMVKGFKYSKYKVRENLFYVFWIILMIGKGLGYNSGSQFFTKIVLIGGIFAILSLIMQHWNKKMLDTFLVFMPLGIAVWYFSGNKDVLLTFLVIFCMVGLNIDKVLKLTLLIRGSLFFSKFFLGIIGVIDKGIFYSYDPTTVRIRYTFGYHQPNTTHYELFIICVLIILIFRYRLKLIHYLTIIAFNFFLYTYTNSRTGVIMVSFLLLTNYFMSHKNKFIHLILNKGTKVFYLTIVIVSIIVCYLVANKEYFMNFGTMSSRFITATRIMYSKGLTLFGQHNVNTDFGFIELLYSNGIIFLIIYIMLNVLTIDKLKGDYFNEDIVVFISYGLYTLFESYSASILMNMSLLYISLLFSKKRRIVA